MSTETVDAETVLRLADKVTVQALGEGEGALILRLDSGAMFTVNDTTLCFVGALDGKRSIEGAMQLVLEEYDVDEETLTRDLVEVATDLLSAELVERV